ncbi:hypothetical protein PoB_000013800 [Plakobranchus ocellatus]|uniref:Uncharacterized protein n=1 Tax=Plakobranchus ocellatus TaxID=259542 RepID=A0AAV3XT11_9GAST|nr:hypothetical protein PoB_000013800 [Plakobranchus ocellatus]
MPITISGGNLASRWKPFQPLWTLIILFFAVNVWANAKAEKFGFFLIETKQNAADGAEACRGLGYDGLAVVSTPETFVYALELTASIR